MRALLVTMPWLSLDRPSLPLGLLRAAARRCRIAHTVDELYANLRWAEFLLAESEGSITPEQYSAIDNTGIFRGVGDWIFAAALHQSPDWQVPAYTTFLHEQGYDPKLAALALQLQRLASCFVDSLADEIVAGGYDLVGLTSTFMQNVPSLALARRLKQRAPNLRIVLGGGNCDGPQGAALHRSFAFLDFVVSGPGEEAFPALLDALAMDGDPAAVPGLCRWQGERQVVNEPSPALPMHRVPVPCHDAYAAALAASPVRAWVEPQLLLESSRGCWWGEKQQCTFCGLNGSGMRFRSRPPRAVQQELEAAVRRFRTLDVLTVDNIMDQRYFSTLLPALAATGWDLRVHYELKANLTLEQVRTLRAAGVWHVQPGIESLSSRVLRLMRKGITGCRNVETLRDCAEEGLTVSWNYLFGFPGETAEDYDAIVERLPLLAHLQPPEAVTRIALERFSPYFEEPDLGFGRRRPAQFYDYIYGLPPEQLAEMVYFFDGEPQGIGEQTAVVLQQAIDGWRGRYAASTLTYRPQGEALCIVDTRWGEPRRYLVEEPLLVAALLALRQNHTSAGLYEALAKCGVTATAEAVTRAVERLQALGLLFAEGERYVALPLRARAGRVKLVETGSAGAW